MNWWRRLGAPGALAVAVAVVVLAATIIRFPGASLLPPLPGLHQPDYSPDARAHLAPFRHDFVAQRIGPAVLAQIATLPAPRPEAPTGVARAGNSGRPGKAASTTTAAPTPASHNIISNALATGSWDLVLGFSSDRATVTPGQDIVYTLTVRNVGRAVFNGRVDLRSHVPLFTSSVSDPVCVVETLTQLVANQTEGCPLPGLPLPPDEQDLEVAGQPVPLTGLTWTTQTIVPPGASLVRSFTVTVNPGADGRDITDHAHISVIGAPSDRSSDVVVHVISQLPVPPS